MTERKKWIEAGKPMRSEEEIKRIHDLCSQCPMFRKKEGHISGYDKCGICECNLHPTSKTLNKIAWATTECPKDDPEWTAEAPEGDSQG